MSRISRLTTVLCFGDSWTHGNSIALDNHLRATGHHNVRVISHDYWGSTAEYFANNTGLLPDAVSNTNAEYVLLSMGGNDYKNIYWRQKRYIAPWKAVAEIESNVRNVLDALYARHPNVKVVTYGYDFPGDIAAVVTGSLWGNTKELTTTTKLMLFLYIRFLNSSFMRIGGMYERLSKDYNKKNNSFTYIPLWGTLQQATEEKKETIRMGYPSLPQFMDDPIHANYLGFSQLLSRLYHSYFKSEFTDSNPMPATVPSVSPSEVVVSV